MLVQTGLASGVNPNPFVSTFTPKVSLPSGGSTASNTLYVIGTFGITVNDFGGTQTITAQPGWTQVGGGLQGYANRIALLFRSAGGGSGPLSPVLCNELNVGWDLCAFEVSGAPATFEFFEGGPAAGIVSQQTAPIPTAIAAPFALAYTIQDTAGAVAPGAGWTQRATGAVSDQVSAGAQIAAVSSKQYTTTINPNTDIIIGSGALILLTPGTTVGTAAISQVFIEALTALNPDAVLSQVFIEALTALDPDAILSQVFIEAMSGAPQVAPPVMDFILIGGPSAAPIPTLAALVQNGSYVQAVVVMPTVTGALPLTGLRIYRAPTPVGPWTLVDSIPASPISAYNNLFDLNPSIGYLNYYAATVVNATGTESERSALRSISAQST